MTGDMWYIVTTRRMAFAVRNDAVSLADFIAWFMGQTRDGWIQVESANLTSPECGEPVRIPASYIVAISGPAVEPGATVH